jgi:hypothetical protein
VTQRTEEMDDPTMPAKVNPGMSVEAAFGAFAFLIGQVVRHKTRPRVRWVVLCRKMAETVGGVSRCYSARSVMTDMDGSGPLHEQTAEFFEHELMDGAGDFEEDDL